MGKVKTIARRSFLIGSVALAGGVAFGTYMVKKPYPNPLLDELDPGEAAFNPWVKISEAGITLITPHADIGQGIVSTQAALIAEELDVDFGQFDVTFGSPDPAYYNTAMGAEGAPFLSTDDSFQAEAMRGTFGALFKLIGVQATGGSSSIPDSYEKLRHAGAVARETLKLAAANETGVPVSQLKTASAAVILPDGSTRPYTQLASAAAKLDPVDKVTLRDPSQWRLLGKALPRLDMVGKCTGELNYGVDLEVENMVHAAVQLNPRRTAMTAFDATMAKGMPGVEDIIEVNGGIAALANSTWRAMKAAEAVACTFADAVYPAEQSGHWEAVEASYTEERLDKEWRNEGDISAALEAGNVITAEYRAPYVAHQPLEPLNAIVRVTENAVEVWSGHQMPRFVQQQVAGVTGHEADQVIFHNQYAGGSFGHRLEFDHLLVAAEIANKVRGQAVKLTFSREQDFALDYPRQIAASRGAGTVKNGQVESYDLQIAALSSSRSQAGRLGQSMPGADAQIVAGAWNHPYAFAHQRIRGYAVPELAPTSSWRSVGAATAAFFADSFMDELIHAAGADPLEERLRLCQYDGPRKVLEAVGEMSNWGSALPEGSGRGIAYAESFGVPTAEVVEVSTVDGAIKIDRVYIALDVGRIIDPVNFENQVQGGVIWGLGHAMNCEITFSGGVPDQTNYHAHEAMRLYQAPEIMVRGLEIQDHVRGVGEPTVPPTASALANAIFAASGQRLREMPFGNSVDFL